MCEIHFQLVTNITWQGRDDESSAQAQSFYLNLLSFVFLKKKLFLNNIFITIFFFITAGTFFSASAATAVQSILPFYDWGTY